MKKFIALLLFVVLSLPVYALAAWTIDVSLADVKGNYVVYKVECTSDGNALTATNLVALMNQDEWVYVQRGAALLFMNTVPGTGGTAPNATIDVTLTDIASQAVFAITAISNVANTAGTELYSVTGTYPVITTAFYLTLNDIGDAADSVTFYIYCWVEGN